MQKQIIVLNGMARSGKQTVYDILNSKIKCEQYSIVDPVRKFLKDLGVSENSKSEQWRKLMSDIKLRLEEYDDIPYQCTKEVVMDFLRSSTAKILSIDMREIQDITKIVDEYNAIKVLVVNYRADDITSNPADAGVYDIEYDYMIINNGSLKELEDNVSDFIACMLENRCDKTISIDCLKLKCRFCNENNGDLDCTKE